MSHDGSRIASDQGVEAIYLPTLWHYRSTTLNGRISHFCRSRLADFDVVHVYGLYDLIGPHVAWHCRRRQLPYVIEPLGMFGPKVRSLLKKRVYHQVLGRQLFGGAGAIVVTSEHERQELLRGGVPQSKVLLRRNGIDLSEFESLPNRGAFRAKLGISATEPLALFMGRLSFIKGLDVLIQAFAQANTQARLVIAGPDDGDGCREAIGRLIVSLSLERRVSILPPVYKAEKLEALVDADLFVLPSIYESFGNVAAEAVACGTPVLVTEGCGIAPLIANGAGVVTSCSVEGLAIALRRLLTDDSLRLQLSNGCARLVDKLSWDEPVATMERIYGFISQGSSPADSTAAA